MRPLISRVQSFTKLMYLRAKVIRGNMKSRSAHGSRINMAAAVFKIKIEYVYRNSGT